MAEMWDVAAHVESNPEDHPQRWRLVKKLYAAHEYRLVIEHLNILKNDWTPKMNVCRYLGATYYRLGRYDDAIIELEDSIPKWPDEIGMREQLAYVLKAAKHYEKALDAWKEVLRLQPDHAIAKKAAERLDALILSGEDIHEAETKFDSVLDIQEDMPTPTPMPGMECIKCGAQNSEEMGNCWRCGTPIRRAQKIEQPIILDISEASFFIESKLLGRLGGVAALGLLLAALFMGIRLLLEYSDGNTAFTSLSQLYTYEFVPSRIAAGLTLLFFWPIVLRITVRILCTTSKPKVVHLYIGGTLLGALALVILLMPIPAPLLVPGSGILVLAALVVSVIAVQFRTGKALLVCGIHLLIMSVLGASAFWATEMYRHNAVLNPVSETNTLLGFAAESSENTQRLSSIITPIRDEIEWGSSGSAWLDAKIATTTITIHLEEKDPSLSFQIYEDKKLQFHEELGERRNHTFQYDISPASHYEFAVSGTENLSVQVLIQSLLPFDILK